MRFIVHLLPDHKQINGKERGQEINPQNPPLLSHSLMIAYVLCVVSFPFPRATSQIISVQCTPSVPWEGQPILSCLVSPALLSDNRCQEELQLGQDQSPYLRGKAKRARTAVRLPRLLPAKNVYSISRKAE